MRSSSTDVWFVYVLRCADGTLYTGITKDLTRRTQQHNDGTGARYTRSRCPVKLVYQETQRGQGPALKREAAIKRLTRRQKLAMVRGQRNHRMIVKERGSPTVKHADRLATSTTAPLPSLAPAYLAARERLAAGKPLEEPIPRRPYGRTREELSVIGFGGMVMKDVTPKQATNFVAQAVDRGINYFDVAPFYGNAQQRLGPALKPYRQDCFLACKTLERDAAGAARELKESLRLLKTDHFDLYQLHALTDVEEVEQAFGPGGSMETILKAKQDGKIHYIGFSAHSEEAAHAAMDRFDFDSILFPFGFTLWIKAKFGPSVYKRAKKAGMGLLALKAMAHQLWPRGKQHRWTKTFYEPFDDVDQAALGLRFTLHLPVTAMFPPGHWELFQMALDLAQAGALVPLNKGEQKIIKEIAERSEPIFP